MDPSGRRKIRPKSTFMEALKKDMWVWSVTGKVTVESGMGKGDLLRRPLISYEKRKKKTFHLRSHSCSKSQISYNVCSRNHIFYSISHISSIHLYFP